MDQDFNNSDGSTMPEFMTWEPHYDNEGIKEDIGNTIVGAESSKEKIKGANEKSIQKVIAYQTTHMNVEMAKTRASVEGNSELIVENIEQNKIQNILLSSRETRELNEIESREERFADQQKEPLKQVQLESYYYYLLWN